MRTCGASSRRTVLRSSSGGASGSRTAAIATACEGETSALKTAAAIAARERSAEVKMTSSMNAREHPGFRGRPRRRAQRWQPAPNPRVRIERWVRALQIGGFVRVVGSGAVLERREGLLEDGGQSAGAL